jgi:hypothetical protein
MEKTMSTVVIKCPKTSRLLSTGIEISSDEFDLLDDSPRPVHCPHCHGNHFWTKHSAILVPANRWSDIPEVQDCYMQALRSAEQASAAKEESERDFHLRMERKWMALAEGYQFLSEVERRHGT